MESNSFPPETCLALRLVYWYYMAWTCKKQKKAHCFTNQHGLSSNTTQYTMHVGTFVVREELK